jgi:hypothetical protein
LGHTKTFFTKKGFVLSYRGIILFIDKTYFNSFNNPFYAIKYINLEGVKMNGCCKMTGKGFWGIILAAILGTIFLFCVVQGFLLQVTGEIQLAAIFYFIGLLFLAGAKLCACMARCSMTEEKPVAKKK